MQIISRLVRLLGRCILEQKKSNPFPMFIAVCGYFHYFSCGKSGMILQGYREHIDRYSIAMF